MTPVLASAVIFPLMVAEAVIAARHDRALRRRGAVEPADDVYRVMQIAYPGAFLVLLGEGAWRGAAPDSLVAWGASVFLAAKVLKYWAIGSLGPRWTFRVLVPPGARRVVTGPYRWLAHPNYAAVALELVGTAVAMRALVTGPVVVVGFGALMLRRVQIEEKALDGR